MQWRWLRWIPVALWCSWIYYGSASPVFRADSTRELFGGLNILFRTGAHLAVFGLLALLVKWAWGQWRWAYAGAWLFTTLYAVTDEWHQAFVPGRGASADDVVLDSVGAAAALLVWYGSTRRRTSSPRASATAE